MLIFSILYFQHLNNYLAICRAQDDNDGIGKACDAIAKAFARYQYLKKIFKQADLLRIKIFIWYSSLKLIQGSPYLINLIIT